MFYKKLPKGNLIEYIFIIEASEIKNKGEINVMKDIILDEVMKELNWKERIIIKVFYKLIIKVYNIARITTVNKFIK